MSTFKSELPSNYDDDKTKGEFDDDAVEEKNSSFPAIHADILRKTTTCSAIDLLRAEADRLGGVRKHRPMDTELDLRWAYSVAASWLECRSDPVTMHQWKEQKEDEL